MSTAPKVTFGNKSGTTNLVTNSQVQPQGQPLIASYMDPNPNPAYVYNPGQVLTGQSTHVVAPAPTYDYSINQAGSNSWRNTGGAAVTTGPAAGTVQQTRINDQIERPQYSRGGQSGQFTKKLGPDTDPRQQDHICHPAWWIIGGLIALTLLTLALLWGLGVIGGHKANGSSSVSSGGPVSPISGGSSGTSTNVKPSTNTGGSGSTTAGGSGTATSGGSGSTSGTSGSGSTSLNGGKSTGGSAGGSTATGGSTGTTTGGSTSGSSGVSGTTGVSPVPYNPPSGSGSTTGSSTGTQPTTVQPGTVKPATVAPTVVQPVSVQPVAVSATTPTRA